MLDEVPGHRENPRVAEAQELEALIRSFFVRFGAPREGPDEATAGRLRFAGEVSADARRTAELPTHHEVTIARLGPISIEDHTASFDIAGHIAWTGGGRAGLLRLGGPLRLVQQHRQWRIADYWMNGRSVADTVWPIEASELALGELRIVPRAVFLDADETSVYIDFVHDGGAPVELVSAAIRQARRLERWRLAGATVFRFEPGASGTFGVAVSKAFPLAPGSYEVALEARSATGRAAVTFVVQIPGPASTASLRATTARAPRLRWRAYLRPLLFWFSPVAIAAWLARSGDATLAAFVLWAGGAVLLFGLRGARAAGASGRWLLANAAVAVAMFAGGVYVAATNQWEHGDAPPGASLDLSDEAVDLADRYVEALARCDRAEAERIADDRSALLSAPDELFPTGFEIRGRRVENDRIAYDIRAQPDTRGELNGTIEVFLFESGQGWAIHSDAYSGGATFFAEPRVVRSRCEPGR